MSELALPASSSLGLVYAGGGSAERDVPLDPDLGIYRSAAELEAWLADRPAAILTAPETATLGTPRNPHSVLAREADDDAKEAFKKRRQELVKNTVRRPYGDVTLDATRICEIENRLKNDPALKGKGGVLQDEALDAIAPRVKRALRWEYHIIKKNPKDLNPSHRQYLDERLAVLKKIP